MVSPNRISGSSMDADVSKCDNNVMSSQAVLLEPNAATSMHELLECRICTDFMYPPIYQCHNGHTFCSRCRSILLEYEYSQCPTCRCEMGESIRCLAVEKMADSLLQLDCKHKIFGCPETLKYSTKSNHERNECAYKPYNCPNGRPCAVTGDIPSLLTHLRYHHMVPIHRECTQFQYSCSYDEYPTSTAVAFEPSMVFGCFGRHFVLRSELFHIEMAPVAIAYLRFMGTQKEAQNFRYRLQVQGQNGRKLTWQGVPVSILRDLTSVRDRLDGLILHKAVIHSSDHDEVLKFTVTGNIWKEYQDAPCSR